MGYNLIELLTVNELHALQEIGEGNVESYTWDENFSEWINGFLTSFSISEYNFLVEVLLKHSTVGKRKLQKYELIYVVEGEELQKTKVEMSVLLRVFATLLKIVKKFIKDYNPDILYISGVDKEDVFIPGQKNRVFFSYVEKNAESLGYRKGHNKNGITLIKIDKSNSYE